MKPPCGVRQKLDSGLHSFSQMNTTLMQAKTVKAETQPGGALCVSCCADLRKSCSVWIRQHRLPRLSPCADERLSTESPEKQRLVESWQLPSPWCNFQWQPRQLYCPIFKRLKLKSYSFFFFFFPSRASSQWAVENRQSCQEEIYHHSNSRFLICLKVVGGAAAFKRITFMRVLLLQCFQNNAWKNCICFWMKSKVKKNSERQTNVS